MSFDTDINRGTEISASRRTGLDDRKWLYFIPGHSVDDVFYKYSE